MFYTLDSPEGSRIPSISTSTREHPLPVGKFKEAMPVMTNFSKKLCPSDVVHFLNCHVASERASENLLCDPEGNTVYFLGCSNHDQLRHISCDSYKWKNCHTSKIEGLEVAYYRVISNDKITSQFQKRVFFHPCKKMVLVQYLGSPEGLVRTPHRNRKNDNSEHIRTSKLLLNDITNVIASKSSAKVYKELAREPVTGYAGLSVNPRNLKQVQNARQQYLDKNRIGPDVYENLILMAKELDFVIQLKLEPDEVIVCANKDSFEELENVCSTIIDDKPLCFYYDTTFNLGT